MHTHAHRHNEKWHTMNHQFIFLSGEKPKRAQRTSERLYGSENPKLNLLSAEKVYVPRIKEQTDNKQIIETFEAYLNKKKNDSREGGIDQQSFQGFVRAWETMIKLLKAKVSGSSIANSELFKAIREGLNTDKVPSRKELDRLSKKLQLKLKSRKSIKSKIDAFKPIPETAASKLSELRTLQTNTQETIATLKSQLNGADETDTITISQKRLLALKEKELKEIEQKIKALSPQKKTIPTPTAPKAPQVTPKKKEKAPTQPRGTLDQLKTLMQERGVSIESYSSVKKFLNSLGRNTVKQIQSNLMQQGFDLRYTYKYKNTVKTHAGNDGYAGRKTYNALREYFKSKTIAPKKIQETPQAKAPQNNDTQNTTPKSPLNSLKQALENAQINLSNYRSVRNYLKKLGRSKVRDIQQNLVDAGHDLSYSYKYKNKRRTSNGIDGIPGRKTYKALIAELNKITLPTSVPVQKRKADDKISIARQRAVQKESTRIKTEKRTIELKSIAEQSKRDANETQLLNIAFNADTPLRYTESETRKKTAQIPKLEMNYGEHGLWNRNAITNLSQWLKAYKDINNYREIDGYLQNPVLKRNINHVQFATYIFNNKNKEVNFHQFDESLNSKRVSIAGFKISGGISHQFVELHKIHANLLKQKQTQKVQDQTKAIENAIIENYKALQALEKIFALIPKMEVQQRRAINELDQFNKYTQNLDELLRPNPIDPVQTEYAGIMPNYPVQIFPTRSAVQALKQRGISFPTQAVELFVKLYGAQNIKPYIAYQKEVRSGKDLVEMPRLIILRFPEAFLKQVKSLINTQESLKKNPKKLKQSEYETRLALLKKDDAAIIQLHKVFNFNDLGPEGIKYKGGLPTFKNTGRPITMEEIQSGRINAASKNMLGNFLSGRAGFLRMRDRLEPQKPGFAERMKTEFNSMLRKGILYAIISSNEAKGKKPAQYMNAAMAKLQLTDINQPLSKEQIMLIRRGFLVNEGKLKIEQEIDSRPVPPKNALVRQIASLTILRLRAQGLTVGPSAQDRMLKAINQKITAGFGVHVDTTNAAGLAVGGGINVDLGNGWSVNISLSLSSSGLLPGAGVSKRFHLGKGVTIGIHVAGHGLGAGAGADLSIPLEGLIPMDINVSGSVNTLGVVTATLGGSYNLGAHERMTNKEKQKKFKKLDDIINNASDDEKFAVIEQDTRFKQFMNNPKISKKQKKNFVDNAFKLTLVHARDARSQISNIETIRDLKVPPIVSGGVGLIYIPGTPIPIPFLYLGIKIGDKFVMASCEDKPLTAEQRQQLLAHARKEQNAENIVYLNSTGASLGVNNFSYDRTGNLRGIIENNNNSRVESMVTSISAAQSIDTYNEQFNRAQVSLRKTDKQNVYGFNIDNANNARVKIKIAPELAGKVHLMYSQNGFNGVDAKIAFRKGTRFAISRFNMYYPRQKEGAHKHVTIYIKPNINWPERQMDSSAHGQLARNPNHTFTYTGNSQENVHRASAYNENQLEKSKTIDAKAYQNADNALVKAITEGVKQNIEQISDLRKNQLRKFADAIFNNTNTRLLTTFQYYNVKGSGTPDIGRLMDQIRTLARNPRFNQLLGGNSLRNHEINMIMMRFVHLSFRQLQRPGRSKQEVMRIFNRTMERFAYPLLKNIFNQHFDEMFDSQESALLRSKGWSREQIVNGMISLLKQQFKNIDFNNSPTTAISAAEMFTSMVGTRGKAGLIIGLRTLAGYDSGNSLDNDNQAHLLNTKEYRVDSANPAQRGLARLILTTSSRLNLTKNADQETASERAKILNSPLALKLARYTTFIMGPAKATQLASMIKNPNSAQNNAVYREFRQILETVRQAQLSGQPHVDYFTSPPLENGVIRIAINAPTTKVGIYKRCGNLSFAAQESFSMALILPQTLKGNSAAARGFNTLRSKGGRMIRKLFGGVSVKFGNPPQQPTQRVEGGGKTQAKNPTKPTKAPGSEGKRANENDPNATKGGTINGTRPKAPPPSEPGTSKNSGGNPQVLNQNPNGTQTLAKPVKNMVIDLRNAKITNTGSNSGNTGNQSGQKGNVGSRF